MALTPQKLKRIAKQIELSTDVITHNENLFEIYEGDLLTQIKGDLQKQLSAQSYEQAKFRIAPINVMKKLISKLSTLYSKAPTRLIVDGSPQDQELLDWYVEKMCFNENMVFANEFANLFKNSHIEPFVKDGLPHVRVIPSDMALPYSDDVVDKTNMTAWVKFMGEMEDGLGGQKRIFFVYDAEDFVIIDSDGNIDQALMNAFEREDNSQPFGRIPATYVNTSAFKLIPIPDSDTLTMTKLIPILMSDLNYVVMFQAFAVMFGIDVDFENLTKAPNAFWSFKTKKGAEKPSVGTIKTDANIIEVMELILGQLAFWMESRDIRPGNIGTLKANNFANGISKIIDEADTSKNKEKQIKLFQKVEQDFWDLLMHHMHPVWAANGEIADQRLFTAGAKVMVEFDQPKPFQTRMELISEQSAEVNAGFTSLRRAIGRLNPDMTQDDIMSLMAEIVAEKIIDLAPQDDHIHEKDGEFTGPKIALGDQHFHMFGAEQTALAPDEEGHTHNGFSAPIEPKGGVDGGEMAASENSDPETA